MNAPTHDPWQARLSEYLDGELQGEERSALEAHLAACAPCRAILDELSRVVAAARALPVRSPERDLWPAIESALLPPWNAEPRARARAWPRTLLAFAAGVLVALGATLLLERREPPQEERVARAESYLLLLHEGEDFAAGTTAEEHARIVERYSSWARDLGARCIGGDELEEGGLELRPGASEPGAIPSGPRIGGYFLVDVADRDEALALARTCPHLEQGGWIELRRIRPH